jgi:hypothetical protein
VTLRQSEWIWKPDRALEANVVRGVSGLGQSRGRPGIRDYPAFGPM